MIDFVENIFDISVIFNAKVCFKIEVLLRNFSYKNDKFDIMDHENIFILIEKTIVTDDEY